MDKKIVALISLVAGIAIGANWPKIKKELQPILDALGIKSSGAYNAIVKLVAEKKESFEDMIAASKVSKKKEPQAKKTRTTRKTSKVVPMRFRKFHAVKTG